MCVCTHACTQIMLANRTVLKYASAHIDGLNLLQEVVRDGNVRAFRVLLLVIGKNVRFLPLLRERTSDGTEANVLHLAITDGKEKAAELAETLTEMLFPDLCVELLKEKNVEGCTPLQLAAARVSRSNQSTNASNVVVRNASDAFGVSNRDQSERVLNHLSAFLVSVVDRMKNGR